MNLKQIIKSHKLKKGFKDLERVGYATNKYFPLEAGIRVNIGSYDYIEFNYTDERVIINKKNNSIKLNPVEIKAIYEICSALKWKEK